MRTKVKKLTSVILAVVMMLGILTIAPLTVSAATYGDFEYTLEDDYTCTITKYNGSAANVTIPSTIYGNKVCKIGAYAFRYNEDVVSVKIPYGIKKIDSEGFQFCTQLKSVTLPNSLTTIGFEAFSGCERLEYISIPSSVDSVDSYAFEDCKSLRSAKIEEGVETFGRSVFGGCESLTSLILPNSLKSIDSLAFSGCVNLKTISFGRNLKSINDNVFTGHNWWEYCKKLEKITVDSNNSYYCTTDGVMYDKKKTNLIFYPYAKSNSTFTIPSSIKTLYSETIVNNSYLKTITIPASVTDIKDNAVGYIEGDWDYNKVSDFTIKGYKGTAAERYARNNDFNFVQLQVVPTSVALNKTTLTLDTGKTSNLRATVYPSNATNKKCTWNSSNTSVATVDGNGKVTAKASGTATITVKTSNGKTATCKVTVNLPAPQITGLTNTTGGVKISWNKVDGAYGYRLYYKPASGGWKRFKDTTATSFTDSGVVPNKTETYTIRCIDKNGNTISGFNSTGWSKKYTPVAPTITRLSNSSKGVSVTWDKIAGVYGYRIYQKTSNGWKRIKDTTATSYTDSAVSANQSKTYTIRCIDKNGKTVSGFNSKGWSKKYTPVAPTITRLSNTSKGVSVTWNKIAGVYGYRLYRKYDGGSWTKVKDTTSTSFTDSGAKKGKKVTYTVRCIDRKGKTVSGFNSKGWSITRK